VEAANEHWKIFAVELVAMAPQALAPSLVLN
jgi:hypothetical protein